MTVDPRPRETSVIVLVDADDRLCMEGPRAKQDFLHGQIVFPGGRLEPGETVEEALFRECHQELGVRPRRGLVLDPIYNAATDFTLHPVLVTDWEPRTLPDHVLDTGDPLGWYARADAEANPHEAVRRITACIFAALPLHRAYLAYEDALCAADPDDIDGILGADVIQDARHAVSPRVREAAAAYADILCPDWRQDGLVRLPAAFSQKADHAPAD